MFSDYFDIFLTKEGLDFTRLVDDDFFQPVRILFQNEHYVSATKLLLIAIDSIGFIEFGDIGENTFIKWLDTYAGLSSLGVTSEELWEQRNSLLHMSNLSSRKVELGKTRRLITYVGEFPKGKDFSDTEVGYYSLTELTYKLANACGKWVESYNIEREKIYNFVKRYDLIASDARMLKIKKDWLV